MVAYRNIPFTDVTEARPEKRGDEDGWAVKFSNGTEGWQTDRIFRASIHKDVRLADYASEN